MRRIVPLAPLLLVLAAPPAAAAEAEFAPLLDVRVRQELLDGVLHVAPDPRANWLRVRTRGGASYATDRHRCELRLANEHRRYLHPDTDFDWDELVVDRAAWRWGDGDVALTVGRQDIMWPGGFLVLDGTPLDGSRTAWHDAVRLRLAPLEVAFVRNLERDALVLAGDDERPLRDMDETGLLVRSVTGVLTWSFIFKWESDPDGVLDDLSTFTGGLRYDRTWPRGARTEAEVAVQYQDFRRGGESLRDGHALALQAFHSEPYGDASRVEAGVFFYSGDAETGKWSAFRAPWGRWPKWSELYIYTLIGESTPGRVTVAAWENIAAPRVQLHFPVGPLAGRAGVNYLVAPQPDWQERGLLTQAELKADVGAGVTGHLLWEMLVPGAFHDGANGLPPLTDTVHFLRWQVAWTL